MFGVTCIRIICVPGLRNCPCYPSRTRNIVTRNFTFAAKMLQQEQSSQSESTPETENTMAIGTGKKARITVTLAREAEKAPVEEHVKPKNHPGVTWIQRVDLPERFVTPVQFILSHENIKETQMNAVKLNNYLQMRLLPVEDEEYRDKASYVEDEIVSQDSILEPFLSEEQLKNLEHNRHQKIKRRLKRLIYHWEPIDYSGTVCFEYLVSRTAAEYASLSKVFTEISTKDPNFRPLSMCDFGSGVGSVLWACHQFWGSSIREYLAVDMSRDMNDLAETILRGGSLANDHWLHGLFFRQFLPASSKIKCDIVVSGYSLLELPSLRKRIETVDILWKKTEKYLALIERGTNAGFVALIQARDYILGLHEEKKANCHVFSPCPTDSWCPKFEKDSTPCNFLVRYRPLLPFGKELTKREVFSYIVLKRGKRNDTGWPKVVREPLVRARHVTCRLCTKKGDLAEVVLTKGRSSRELYRCGRKSHIGDLLPVDELETLEKYDPKVHGPVNEEELLPDNNT